MRGRLDKPFTLAVLGLLLAASADAAVDRNLTASWPGAEARRVAVVVPNGELVVVPSGDGTVRVSVALEARTLDLRLFRWVSGRAQDLVAAAAFDAVQGGDQLRLSLRYPAPAADHVTERWHIELPPDSVLAARVNAGTISVRDINGGLDLDVNVGSIRVDLEFGPVRAEVNVGDIVLDSQAAHFGTVLLQSNVGETVIDLRGRPVAPLRSQPPGSFARLQGDGDDFYLLNTNVGSVRLHLRRP